jgi:hypothetical protein
LLASLLGLGGASAEARETTGRLFVARAEQALECPDAEALRARVEGLMGRAALSSNGPPEVNLEVQISRRSHGYRAVVRVSGTSSGIRELEDEGPGCDSLADALTVTLAVLLDWQGGSTLTPKPLPTSPPAALPPGPAPPAPAPEPWSPSLGLALGGGLAPRVLPHLSSFVALELELELRRSVRLAAGGFWLPEQSQRLQEGTITTGYAGGLALGCMPLRAGPVELGPCGGLALGRFWTRGEGYDQNSQVRRLWIAPGLGLDSRGPLGKRLSWTLRALGHVPLRAQTISVADVGTVEVPRAGVFVKIGLVVSIF